MLSSTLRFVALIVTTLPETIKLPVTVTSPEIVPPEAEYFVLANAYAIDRGDDSQIKFQDALRHMGFDVKLKPFIQRQDGSAKGDWDVGITIDVLLAAQELDRVILLSGDGDFDMLMTAIKKKYNTETEVFGVKRLMFTEDEI